MLRQVMVQYASNVNRTYVVPVERTDRVYVSTVLHCFWCSAVGVPCQRRNTIDKKYCSAEGKTLTA